MSTPSSKSQIFWQRLGSTFGLWVIILPALFATNSAVTNLSFLLIVSLLGIIGIREYAQMFSQTPTPVLLWPTIVTGLTILLFSSMRGWQPSFIPSALTSQELDILIPTLLLLWLLGYKLWLSGRVPLASLAVSLMGWFYTFWLLTFITKIYYFPAINGSWLLLYFILVTKFSDLGAYVIGSLCGRHKMTPRISPGKTWEGFAGAIGVSTLVSVITVYATGSALEPFRGAHCIVLGILLSGLAVVGDLVESLLKRETGVKDSGNLFPGIGGCLDLIDSLLFNAPLFYLYCRLALTN
ncbi:MAG: Phosphatidate cytidylyltransferase [Verrucomicrobia subdivision 3 bacterium]|nr:Phosphatidate cytidylyltransferase [Limisphaerales bacterium]MCS1415689.1 Phosphatidate cytidylyltransferase [Limisphaerales bacterium]